MRQVDSRRIRRPVIVALRIAIEVGRRVRASCEPLLRGVARVVVRVADTDADVVLTAHVIVAATAGAAIGIGASLAGVGSSELCKIGGAVLVGALAVSAATLLVRRRVGAGEARPALRPLLAHAARQVAGEPAQHPAGRILRAVYGGHCSPALATAGVAFALLAPALPSPGDPDGAPLLRLALKPAERLVPALGLALGAHGAYRHSRASAAFVRRFALAAASLCPAPRELPRLVA